MIGSYGRRRRAVDRPRGAASRPAALGATLAFATLLSGCPRGYLPHNPQPGVGPRLNAVASEAELSIANAGARVTMQTVALSGSRLVAAGLVSSAAKPCSGGVGFAVVSKDGFVATHGPLDVAGRHELSFTFQNQGADDWPLLSSSSSVDLQIESPEGKSCTRVPVGGESEKWELGPSSSGGLWDFAATFFPVETTSIEAAQPTWLLRDRLGMGWGKERGWFEVGVGGDRSRDLFFNFALGRDHVLWESGRWLLRGGVAYDLVLSGKVDPSWSSRYTLHGPRITPSLEWTPFWTSTRYPGFPMGRRTGYLALELPIAVWFGVGDAPTFVFVPGVAIAAHVGF